MVTATETTYSPFVQSKRVIKQRNHRYFFILDGKLWECYKTQRGPRAVPIMDVPEEMDCDRCTDIQIDRINNRIKLSKDNV